MPLARTGVTFMVVPWRYAFSAAIISAAATIIWLAANLGSNSRRGVSTSNATPDAEALSKRSRGFGPSAPRDPIRPSDFDSKSFAAIVAKFLPDHTIKSPSHLLHLLMLWGHEFTPGTATVISGPEMLSALLRGSPHPLYKQPRPFIYYNSIGDLECREYGVASQPHLDQALAVLADLGVRLDTPVGAPTRRANLRGLLNASVSKFAPGQECEWSIVAYAHFLPPARNWRNKWGEVFDFDIVARFLLERDLGEGSCLGTHRLLALSVILRADEVNALLRPQTRLRIIRHLARAREYLKKNQMPHGCWTPDWFSDSFSAQQQTDYFEAPRRYILALATGHHLEWLSLAGDGVAPSRRMLQQAVDWCYKELANTSTDEIRKELCPYTHCLRSVLRLGMENRSPSEFLAHQQ